MKNPFAGNSDYYVETDPARVRENIKRSLEKLVGPRVDAADIDTFERDFGVFVKLPTNVDIDIDKATGKLVVRKAKP